MSSLDGPFANLIPYWNAVVYTDESKGTVLSTISQICQLQATVGYDAPGTYTLTCYLADQKSSQLQKSNYLEIWSGRQQSSAQAAGPPANAGDGHINAAVPGIFTPGRTVIITGGGHTETFKIANVIGSSIILGSYGGSGSVLAHTYANATLTLGQTQIANGTIQQVTKNIDRSMLMDISFDDALIALTYYRCLDMPSSAAMGWPTYKHIGDLLNGALNPKTGKRGDAPGYYSIAPSTCTFKWVDAAGTHWPGKEDLWETSLETSTLNLTTLGQRYNFHHRLASQNDDGTPCTPRKMTVECGPFHDHSGLTIWGGMPLIQKINTILSKDGGWLHGRNPDAYKPSATLAQKFGLAVINGPQYADGLDYIWNLYWCTGAGSGSSQVTLAEFWTDDPDRDPGAVPWGPTAGCTLSGSWGSLILPAPVNGRKYYVLADRQATWGGSHWFFVASQRWDASWEYGILKTESVQKYNVRENVLQSGNKKIKTARELAAAGAAAVEYYADPVETFQFPVLHPRTSPDAVPHRVRPGQQVSVNYQGKIPTAVRDTDSNSSTYGQLIPGPVVTYLDFPGTTDPDRIKLLQTVIGTTETWSKAGYAVTYQMGHGKWRPHNWQRQVAKQLEHISGGTGFTNASGSNTGTFDGLHVVMSKDPWAWKGDIGVPDYKPAPPPHSEGMWMQPGAMFATFDPKGKNTGDNLSIHFWAFIHGNDQFLDFGFAFPPPQFDSSTGQPINLNPLKNPGGTPINYGVFRLAMHGSGFRTGFHLHNSTSGLELPRGHRHKKHRHIWIPDLYYVKISTAGQSYHAHVMASRNLKHPHAAVWHDNAFEVKWWDGAANAPNMFWHLAGGTVPSYVTHLNGSGFNA